MTTPYSAEKIAQKSKSSFYYAFNLLPKSQREAMNVVYAFCRVSDDIVDGNEDEKIKLKNLNCWREEFNRALKGKSNNSLLNKLTQVISNFNISTEPFFDLLDGMEMDLKHYRYKNFDELKKYCYRVASTVGLISIEIFGYRNPQTREFAINLGIALQLTNILRDVITDYQKNRIYLPQDELEIFHVREQDLSEKKIDGRFVDLMKYQVQRIENYFNKANEYLSEEDKKNMFPARAMQAVYYKLFKKIVRNNYDVVNKKISLSNLEKLCITLKLWVENYFN